MARPAQREPHTSLAAVPNATPLAPTPDNGAAYIGAQPSPAERNASDRPALARNFPNLGVRVTPEMFERVRRYCEHSGMPKATLTARALDKFLADQGF